MTDDPLNALTAEVEADILPPGLRLLIPINTELSETARNYLNASIAPSTRRAYAADLRAFLAWCVAQDVPPMPAHPKTIAEFLAAQASGEASTLDPESGLLVKGPKIHPTTLTRRRAAIRYAHYRNGVDPSPSDSATVKDVMRGIRKEEGVPAKKKKALVKPLLSQVIEQIPDTLVGQRDRALILLGFAGAFRRSELVALNVDDLEFSQETLEQDGCSREREVLRIMLRKSKMDQDGKGFIKPIYPGTVTCPIEALRRWLERAKIQDGPVFRRMHKSGCVTKVALSGQTVAILVKHYAARAGFDPAVFAGHSLRRGFVTSADQAGARLAKIKQVTGQSVPILVGYIEDAEQFKDHAAEGLL